MNAYQIVRVLLDADLKSVDAATVLGRKYTVLPMTRTDCDCEDCRAGKHLYELFRWTAGQWQSVAWSLQSYASAEECKRNHYWGVAFQPGDTWEDGTPIVRPEDRRQTQPKTKEPGTGRMVPLDTDSLGKAAKALEKHWCQVDEATVRLPPRCRRYVATFSGPEVGVQVTRSTGLTDRDAAMELARKWEVQASAERSRRKSEGTWGIGQLGRQNAYLTQAEIAAILGLSERAVRAIEKRALLKLRRHPLLREVWAEFASQPVEEDAVDLEPEEIGALFGLVRTPFERRVLLKVLFLAWMDE